MLTITYLSRWLGTCFRSTRVSGFSRTCKGQHHGLAKLLSQPPRQVEHHQAVGEAQSCREEQPAVAGCRRCAAPRAAVAALRRFGSMAAGEICCRPRHGELDPALSSGWARDAVVRLGGWVGMGLPPPRAPAMCLSRRVARRRSALCSDVAWREKQRGHSTQAVTCAYGAPRPLPPASGAGSWEPGRPRASGASSAGLRDGIGGVWGRRRCRLDTVP